MTDKELIAAANKWLEAYGTFGHNLPEYDGASAVIKGLRDALTAAESRGREAAYKEVFELLTEVDAKTKTYEDTFYQFSDAILSLLSPANKDTGEGKWPAAERPDRLPEEFKRQYLGDWPVDERNEDGTLKHILKEGSRRHVVSWSAKDGARCSEPNCEMNRKPISVA